MTFIELSANQIVLDPQIIRKTMQALKQGKSSVGLIQDDRKQIELRINPDIAFSQLQVDPPIVTPINKERTHFSLIAKYWQIDLIGLLIKINPHEKLNCLLQLKIAPKHLPIPMRIPSSRGASLCPTCSPRSGMLPCCMTALSNAPAMPNLRSF